MRRLTVDIYKIIYRITDAKKLSIALALVYITFLNLVTIQGLGMLLEDWLRKVSLIHVLFVFPYYLITAFIILSINFLLLLPLKNLRKEKTKKPVILPIIIYSAVCILLFFYIHYSKSWI